MNRDYKEMIIVCIMIPIGIFTAYLCLFGWIASHEQSRYLKNHYNINISTTDLFWNQELVTSELRSKGIITEKQQDLLKRIIEILEENQNDKSK